MIYQAFGILSIFIGLLRYGTYIRAIIAGTTKPHPLTWLSGGLLAGIAFWVQYGADAGPTIWVTGMVAVFCIGIGVLSIFLGEKEITRTDWISLFSPWRSYRCGR